MNRKFVSVAIAAGAMLVAVPVAFAQQGPTWSGSPDYGNSQYGSDPGIAGTTTPQAGRVFGPGDRPGRTGPGGYGSSGGYFSGSGSSDAGGRVIGGVQETPDASRRGDPGQRPIELMQTSLLNAFSAHGFTAVRDFRKAGDRYQAEVQDQSGRWMTVELDPRTGTIASVR
jgi:hypothetical protein